MESAPVAIIHSQRVGVITIALAGTSVDVAGTIDGAEQRCSATLGLIQAPHSGHFHGSAGDTLMTHLAIWEAPRDGEGSSWGEAVTDEEYRSALNRARR